LIVQAKMHASKLAAQVSKNTGKSVVVHPFAHWMKLGVAESRMVGKTEQSPISPPVWVEEPAAIVSKDEYAKFVDLRKDLDMFLPTSRYAPKAAPQLPSKSAPQLPAGDEDEGEWTIR
jgi:hypothetical protein